MGRPWVAPCQGWEERFLSILQALEAEGRSKHRVPEHPEASRGGAEGQPWLLELRIILKAQT